MTQTTPDQYQDAVKRSVRAAFNLGYTVRHNPYSSKYKWPPLQAKKPATVPTWFLDPATMLTKVVTELATFASGTVKQLMASTGAGKTTVLPVYIAKQMNIGVMVLVPTIMISGHVCAYVQSHIAETYGMSGNVFELTSSNVRMSSKPPAVFFAAAGEFLAQLCADKNLMRNLSIGLIIVDESHVIRPEYEILKRLIAVGVFSDTKLLFVSATATGASDVSKESTDKRVSMTIPADIDMDGAPSMHPTTSPLYALNINARTLVFFSDDRDFPQWLAYYKSFDVPVMSYGYENRISELPTVTRFFMQEKVGVVLTTGILDTSFTFPFDVVIDTGRQLVPRFMPDTLQYATRREFVTKSQQVQRAGRVGRITMGTAWNKRHDYGTGLTDFSYEVAQYTYLWSRMFNMTINDPSVSAFDKFFGHMSLPAIGMALTCAFPPVVLAAYTADDGLYPQWAPALKVLMGAKDTIVVSKTTTACDTSRWPERIIPALDGDMPAEYKSKLELSYPYDVLACYVWMVGEGDPVEIDTDAATMYGGSVRRGGTRRSFAPPVPKIPDIFRSGTKYTVDGTVYNPKRSAKGKQIQTPAMPVVPDASETESVTEEVPTMVRELTLTKANLASMPVVTQQRSRVASWASSTSSTEMAMGDLRPVKSPKRYWQSLMYPYDLELLTAFNSHHAATHNDVKRYHGLMSGKRKFSALHKDSVMLKERQDEYALSILRVHRVSVIDGAQSSVGAKESTSFIDRLFGNDTNTTDAFAERAKNAAGQLEMMMLVGYVFAVSTKKKHSGIVPVSGLYALRKQAEYALSTGDKRVIGKIESLRGFVAPFRTRLSLGNQLVAQAWNMNNRLFTPDHVYEDMEERVRKQWVMDAGERIDVEDDIALYNADSPSYEWRMPVDGEYVYVVRFDNIKSEIKAYGFSKTHVGSVEIAYVACVLVPGCSGALVVAANDGHVVGMYVGDTYVEDEVSYARYVPASMIFKV